MKIPNLLSLLSGPLLAAGMSQTLGVTAEGAILYTENFDSVALGPNEEEGITTDSGGLQPAVWTKTTPDGWTIDDSQMQGQGDPATDGVVEWSGWSFADQRWWGNSDNQNREMFVKGGGAVAVTDPDEWDDLPRIGAYNSFLLSPQIPVTAGQEMQIRFDSSWRPEALQKALVSVSWDGGEFVEILRWESDANSAAFHPDAENETVTLPLTPPAGTQNMRLRFGTIDAQNNWWWTIDNLVIYTGAEPPHFETHPVSSAELPAGSSVAIANGGAVEFMVTLTEAATLQWVKMSGGVRTALAQQTAETLSLPVLKLTDDGDYLVEATNAGGTVRSAPVRVDVQNFTITLQPAPLEILSGEAAVFTVAAEGQDALAYQWFKGPANSRVEIPGASTATLTLPAATAAADGFYSVRITGGTDTAFSDAVALRVLPLRIDQQPVSLTVDEGGGAVFEVTASGQGLTYQWYFRQAGAPEAPVTGATGPSLTVPSIARFGDGYFSVRITNTLGMAASSEAKLTVNAAPGPLVLFQEDWSSVVLGPNVEEGIETGAIGPAREKVWSSAAPAGWVIDNSAMPQPLPENISGTDGVREWYGWTFAEPLWWAETSGGQGRAGFTKGIGNSEETGIPAVIAVADSDEWDDLPHGSGRFVSSLTSPPVALAGAVAGSVVLVFDSSWQREPVQKAKVEVSLDGGAFQQILLWTDDGPDRHDDATDETVQIAVNTPAGAGQLRARFTVFDAGNNWWWAVDNIKVTARAGIPPADAAVINSVVRNASANTVTLQWTSVPLRAYTLEYSENLTVWQALPAAIPGAAGATTETSVNVGTLFPGQTPGRLYFRIRG